MAQNRSKNKQKIEVWHTLGQDLNIQSNLEIFSPPLLAIKELLQGGAVAGGKDAECLVRFYSDDNGKMHLLIANSSDTPANIQQMLDYGVSKSETISSVNGVGVKTGLSYFSSDEKTRGKFIIATKDGENTFYKTSPYGERMPMHSESNEDFKWPVDEKYRTYIDTEVDDMSDFMYEVSKYMKNELKIKEIILGKDSEGKNIKGYTDDTINKYLALYLNEYLGALFGFRIEDGMNLRIETPDAVIEKVQPNLPEMQHDQDFLYGRKEDPKTRKPELTVNHEQSFSKECADGKSLDFAIQNAVCEKTSGYWKKRLKTEGAWLIQDGVVQTYLGTDIFGVTAHNSMNGMYTFIHVDSQDGATLKEEKPAFDKSKTTLRKSSELWKTLREYFNTAEPERNRLDTRYEAVNSIRAWYRRTRESDTEKEIRKYLDKLYEVYADRQNDAEQSERYRYVRELYDGKGNIYDGAILKLAKTSGMPYSQRSEDDQQKYAHMAMPDERIELIVEYKKSPLTIEDVDQIINYLYAIEDKGEKLPDHCILCGPTMTKEALHHLMSRFAKGDEIAGKISVRLYNDEFDKGKDINYGKALPKLIDQDVFEKIKISGEYYNEFDILKNVIDNQAPDAEIQISKEDYIFGSIPVSVLFPNEIEKIKEKHEWFKGAGGLNNQTENMQKFAVDIGLVEPNKIAYSQSLEELQAEADKLEKEFTSLPLDKMMGDIGREICDKRNEILKVIEKILPDKESVLSESEIGDDLLKL